MTIDLARPIFAKKQLLLIDGWNPDTGTWSDPEDRGFCVPKLFAALSQSATRDEAAVYAGVSDRTVYTWEQKGILIAETTHVTDRMDLDLGERIYVDFALQMPQVIAGHVIKLIGIVDKGAEKDPELALKILARRYAHWREQKGVDVTSKGESVVVQDRIAELLNADPTLAAKGEDLYLSVAAAAKGEELDDDE